MEAAGMRERERDRQRGREEEREHGAVRVATAIQFAWQHPLWVLDETAAARSWDTLVASPHVSPLLLRAVSVVGSSSDFSQFIYRVLLINILK